MCSTEEVVAPVQDALVGNSAPSGAHKCDCCASGVWPAAVDESNWQNPPYFSSVCSNSSTGVPVTTGTIGVNGYYELESYTYNGTPFYGGKAELRMRGEFRRNGDTKAATIVMQTIDIKPKSCTDP